MDRLTRIDPGAVGCLLLLLPFLVGPLLFVWVPGPINDAILLGAWPVAALLQLPRLTTRWRLVLLVALCTWVIGHAVPVAVYQGTPITLIETAMHTLGGYTAVIADALFVLMFIVFNRRGHGAIAIVLAIAVVATLLLDLETQPLALQPGFAIWLAAIVIAVAAALFSRAQMATTPTPPGTG